MTQSNSVLDNYFQNDSLAIQVWLNKYQLKDKQGNPLEETPDNMHRRMAKEFDRLIDKGNKENINRKELSEYGQTRKELNEESIYNLFKDFKYIIPQGSIMAVLGNPNVISSLSNCFVLGQPADSYGGILQKDQELVQVMKRRGGAGIDISTLRPRNTKVTNAAETSTGAVSFAERFSNSTREVAQDGRRGALMISMDIRHPDILEFINIKSDLTKVTGANISIKVRNDFMEAVKNDSTYLLRFPVDAQGPFFQTEKNITLIDGTDIGNITMVLNPDFDLPLNKLVEYNDNKQGKIFFKLVKAKEIFDAITDNAWNNAEPGLMYSEKHINYSPDGVYSRYRAITSNPCGEIPMGKHDACRLLALNLLSFVNNPYTQDCSLDLKKVYEIAYEQQKLADILVDLELEHIEVIINKINNDPEDDEIKRVERELWINIHKTASSSRRTGCGFTALADMLAALGLKYDSEEAISIIGQLMKEKMRGELDATIDLAIEKGAFNDWDENLEFEYEKLFIPKGGDIPTEGKNRFFDFLLLEYPKQTYRLFRYGRRNVSWSTVAPTGSVSILTQTSSGIEPLFKAYYIRKRKVTEGDEFDYEDNSGDKWKEYTVLHPQFKYWIEKNYPSTNLNSKNEITTAFAKSPWFQSQAEDIDWEKRLLIQAIVQKYTTHSISSTINLPKNVDKQIVKDIYQYAFDVNLKGVTVYRDGSRDGVLISESAKITNKEFEQKDSISRPQKLKGVLHTESYRGEKYGVIVGLLEDKPYEVFAFKGISEEGIYHGDIVKKSKGIYNFISTKIEIDNIQLGDENAEEALLCRMISMMLRHGAKVNFVIDQINKVPLNITSFAKAINKVLKLYIPDGTKSGSKCPDCKENTLIYEEGCKKCTSCSYTAC